MIDFLPTDCPACDTAVGHTDDCPHAEPELPARPTHCDRCGATLVSARELASVDELGYARCDECDAVSASAAAGES